MSYERNPYKPFGIAYAVAVVGTAAANAVIGVKHALKVDKMQQRFKRHLQSDAEKMDYIKYIGTRFGSVVKRLSVTSPHRPGTEDFDRLLKAALKNDMLYQGDCSADVYVPMQPTDKPGPRPVFASIGKYGEFVKGSAGVPRDVGLLWNSKCRTALDEGLIAGVKKYKGGRKHRFLKSIKEDIGGKKLALMFGTGLFMAIVLILVLKTQKALIEEQELLLRPKRKKKKRQRKKGEVDKKKRRKKKKKPPATAER
jgi:hypothetical protein